MSETCRAATLVGQAKIEVREYPVPDIPPDGGLLKVELGGVCGTDYKYYTGKLNLPRRRAESVIATRWH
jgi:threonine dehydrogenase-like Zn-dependent dehydrogenase